MRKSRLGQIFLRKASVCKKIRASDATFYWLPTVKLDDEWSSVDRVKISQQQRHRTDVCKVVIARVQMGRGRRNANLHEKSWQREARRFQGRRLGRQHVEDKPKAGSEQ